MISFPEVPLIYQGCTALGVVTSLVVSKRYKSKLPLNADSLQLYYSVLFLISVVGAYSIGAFSFIYFGDFRYKKSLITGIFLAWSAAEIFKKAFRIRASTGDPLAPGLAIGFCLARVGCLFGHCCYGIRYEGLLALEHHGGTYFPSPVLEIIFHGVSFLIVVHWTRRDLLPGMRLRVYLLCYAIFRFFSEFMRPHEKVCAGLNVFQIVSLLLACEILAAILSERRCRKLSP